MAQIYYNATFASGETAKRAFARKLTHAYRITYVFTANPSAEPAIKIGFSGSYELAAKAIKLAKRYTVLTSEIVDAETGDAVPSKAKAPKKEKTVKPFAIGEQVVVGKSIVGTVEKVGRLYAYITLPGFKAARKYAFNEVTKHSPEPEPLALAA